MSRETLAQSLNCESVSESPLPVSSSTHMQTYTVSEYPDTSTEHVSNPIATSNFKFKKMYLNGDSTPGRLVAFCKNFFKGPRLYVFGNVLALMFYMIFASAYPDTIKFRKGIGELWWDLMLALAFVGTSLWHLAGIKHTFGIVQFVGMQIGLLGYLFIALSPASNKSLNKVSGWTLSIIIPCIIVLVIAVVMLAAGIYFHAKSRGLKQAAKPFIYRFLPAVAALVMTVFMIMISNGSTNVMQTAGQTTDGKFFTKMYKHGSHEFRNIDAVVIAYRDWHSTCLKPVAFGASGNPLNATRSRMSNLASTDEVTQGDNTEHVAGATEPEIRANSRPEYIPGRPFWPGDVDSESLDLHDKFPMRYGSRPAPIDSTYKASEEELLTNQRYDTRKLDQNDCHKVLCELAVRYRLHIHHWLLGGLAAFAFNCIALGAVEIGMNKDKVNARRKSHLEQEIQLVSPRQPGDTETTEDPGYDMEIAWQQMQQQERENRHSLFRQILHLFSTRRATFFRAATFFFADFFVGIAIGVILEGIFRYGLDPVVERTKTYAYTDVETNENVLCQSRSDNCCCVNFAYVN